MDNKTQLLSNITDACSMMAGNIDRFLPKDSKLIRQFVSTVSKLSVATNRCLGKDGQAFNPSGAFRVMGRATGKLLHAYSISQVLAKEYRMASRLRLTECGSDPTRVQLEEHTSKVISLQDLQLSAPIELTIRILVNEADREISSILRTTMQYAIGA